MTNQKIHGHHTYGSFLGHRFWHSFPLLVLGLVVIFITHSDMSSFQGGVDPSTKTNSTALQSDCSKSSNLRSPTATLSSTQENQNTDSNLLFFPQDPQKFNDILLDCRENPKCHLMYHHVPKTAGSLIASRLHPIFDSQGERYRSKEWCCYEVFMDGHFQGNEEEYCTKRGIGIFELWGHEYHQVLDTCQRRYAKEGHSYVGLVSTREPIQRTLSLIHQQCNSGYETKNPTYQSFCRECIYDNDRKQGSLTFFNRFANDTNKAYSTLNDYMNAHQQKDSSISNIPLLVIDSFMLNDWFDGLQQGLIDRHKGPTEEAPKIRNGNSNPENRTICNFGMTSPFLKQLKPSIGTYFDIWRGIQ